MERRGRIPVAKFRTQEAKTRSRSRVREPDYNDQDPDTNLFTLIEDNIALKEENASQKLQLEEEKKLRNGLSEENFKMSEKVEGMKKKQLDMETEIAVLNAKYTKILHERDTLDKLQKKKAEKFNSLSQELQMLREFKKYNSNVVITSDNLKAKLLKIIPSLSANHDMESIVEADSIMDTPLSSDLLEAFVDEFITMKSSINTVELQLYEANEKIAELIENQNHFEEENENLRTENVNLTKVAKLLTQNMKESVETSKKMESALIKMKQRNEELTAKSRDHTDGRLETSQSPSSPVQTNDDFQVLKEEVESQNRDHGERIVEMQNLLEAAIEKSTNDELKTLQIKLSILEEELRNALARADAAESELEKIKKLTVRPAETFMPAIVMQTPSQTLPPPPPPPPPPPMPANLLYKAPESLMCQDSTSASSDSSFTGSIVMHNLHKAKENSASGNRLIATVKQVQPEAATGLDALVREFKTGRVTLRRNRRKTQTNQALQEMFQVLEISQKQNRNSNICVEMHK